MKKSEQITPLANQSFVNSTAGLLSSYLWMGDLENLKLYMTILKEVLNVNKNLWEGIPKKDRERITMIGKALKSGTMPNPWGEVEIFDFDENETKKDFYLSCLEDEETEEDIIKRESELQDILKLTYDSVKFLTGDQSERIVISSEVNMKLGRADIKAQGEKICHVIELKLNEASHKIVGQIMKYMRSVGSKLHYGLYEDVKGITVAKSYSESALLDLQMMGIRTFTYSLSNGSISLNRI